MPNVRSYHMRRVRPLKAQPGGSYARAGDAHLGDAHPLGDAGHDEGQTARIADLAEGIVDEISRSGQDWPAIELRVRELLELVGQRRSGPC